MINNDRLQQALKYLATTDECAANARARMIGLDKQEKTILAIVILAEDGTAQVKESKARVSPEYKKWREDYENAVADFELLRNKRKTEELIVEVWRSENANRRHGNV